MERFLGFTHIPHWRVRDSDGNAPEEDVFDFLYRHTFGRIREVLELGSIIYQMDKEQRSPETVRHAVDQAAGRLFEVYKREMIPFWDRSNEVVFKYINSNVITQHRLNGIYAKISDLADAPSHPFCYLYARGLLGRAKVDKGGGGLKISFVQPGMYLVNNNQHLPACSHYFLHPCLESPVRERSQTFSIDPRVIVGDSLVCDLPDDPGTLAVTWDRRDHFTFFYQGHELTHFSSTGGALYSLIFAILVIAVATKEQREITVDDMLATCKRLIDSGMVSQTAARTNKQDLLEIIRRMDKDKDDTGKSYRRDIVVKIKRSIADMGEHAPDDGQGEARSDNYLSYQNGVFRWSMCDPSDINIVQVTKNYVGKAARK